MPIFYTRGPGPLVSVLLPTRNRPQQLFEAVDSLASLAVNARNMELIFKLDEDDKASIDAYEKIKKILPGPCKAIISPRGRGYYEMHHWVDSMSEIATGDFLYLFNDDSLMLTERWDEVLQSMSYSDDNTWHGCLDISMLITPTRERPGSYEFFFLRRKVFEVLGHYSLNPHTDNWLSTVMCFISSAYTIPVEVSHGNKPIDDDVRKDVLEVYKTAGTKHNSLESHRQRANDVLTLLKYVEDYRKKNRR